MYKLRRDFLTQPVMPTGPNVLADLADFVVTKVEPCFHVAFGNYLVDIDLQKQVGHFQNMLTGLAGDFWLVGRTLVAANHLLPADVRLALREVSIEIA